MLQEMLMLFTSNEECSRHDVDSCLIIYRGRGGLVSMIIDKDDTEEEQSRVGSRL